MRIPYTKTKVTFFKTWVLLLGLVTASSCAQKEVEPVYVRSNAMTTGPLQGLTVVGFDGTYTNCAGHAPDLSLWHMDVSGYVTPSLNRTLTVFRGDAACQLRVVSVLLKDMTTQSISTFSAISDPAGLLISGTYGSSVRFAMGTGTNFYAAIRMTPSDFSVNFIIEFVYTDDPKNLPTIDVTGVFPVSTISQVSASVWASPDYGMDGAGIFPNLYVPVGADHKIGAPTGNFLIAAGTVFGTEYTVADQILGSGDMNNYGDVHTTFLAAVGVGLYVFPVDMGAPIDIPADNFVLPAGLSITGGLDRFIIIARKDLSSSLLTSYQVIKVHINEPPAL